MNSHAGKLGLCVGLFLAGCDPTINFDVPITGETTVPAGGVVGSLISELAPFTGFSDFDFSDTQEFESNDVAREHVQSATLTKLTLTVVAPEDGNLDFLNEISFLVSADGQAPQVVAEKVIEDGLSEVDVDPVDVDLAEFIRSDSVSITTEANAEPPSAETRIRASMTFNITAGL